MAQRKLDEYDPRRGREGRPWRTAADQCYQSAKLNDARCWRCGGLIDYSVPKASTPMSYTTGHRVRVIDGGHPTSADNLAPEHALCNFRDGAEATNRHRRNAPLKTSREWL